MKCKDVQKYLPDFLTSSLAEFLRNDFNAHLESCESCRAEVLSLGALWEKLGSIPEAQPDPGLALRFYALVDAFQQVRQQAKRTPEFIERFSDWLTGWRPRQPAWQFALTASVLIIGLLVGYFFSGGSQSARKIAGLHSEIVDLQQVAALSKLNQDSPGDRLQGVYYSSQIADQSPDVMAALLNTLKSDSNVNVRLAAVGSLYLYRKNSQIHQALIQALSTETSPLVQIALINLISDIREEKVLHALQLLLEQNHLNPEVRKQATESLKLFL